LNVFCGRFLHASDTEDRLAFLQLEVDDANEGFSANVFCKCLLDPGDPIKQPAVIEKIQRIVAGGKDRRRLDGQYTISRGERFLFPFRETMLVTPVECYYWVHTPDQNAKTEIVRETVKAGINPIHTSTVLKHPYLLSICQQNSANMETFGDSILTTKFKVLEEQELSDGRLRSLIVFTNNLAAIEITFSKDPNWAPEIVHFFLRGDKALPADRPLEVGDVKAWNRYATTTTKWKELKEYDRTVPQSVTIAAEDEQGAHLLEFVFSDWKFDKDINKSLLDEDQFTKEKILSAIDFDSLRSSFDQSSAIKR
jgi:hypothetical protein